MVRSFLVIVIVCLALVAAALGAAAGVGAGYLAAIAIGAPPVGAGIFALTGGAIGLAFGLASALDAAEA